MIEGVHYIKINSMCRYDEVEMHNLLTESTKINTSLSHSILDKLLI